MQGFERTGLWQSALGARADDSCAYARERLRVAFQQMREKAAELVKLIPEDCRELTVHDVTHLDALWEMADLVAGEGFSLTPAEAFVFGGAVLIHDAGTTIAAYPNREADLKQTDEWKDTAMMALRSLGLTEPDEDKIQNPPDAVRGHILFEVLRLLHAQQAEKLVEVVWTLPKTGEKIRLLDDQALLDAYAQSIGRVAHSHHWDVEEISRRLRPHVGSVPDPDFPKDWTVNEIKVACLLRCADITHLDRRRAPTLTYALKAPSGISDTHWNFQQHLNRPKREKDSLIFTSGKDFLVTEAASWWMCYEAINAVDLELKRCDALLQDNEIGGFKANRVLGAGVPSEFAKHVVPRGWRPVDAEIKVSDPVGLASALGGRNLYGAGAFAPIRELLQNAADAVRARRKLRVQDDPYWGSIRIVFAKEDKQGGAEYWLHVEDTGIGMSERVMAGPLLDFGKSIWGTGILREEFPGLQGRGFTPIGKFGIGFFSVFLLGSSIRVSSRRFNDAVSDARTLEFEGMVARPLLRDATKEEVDDDYVTRVSVMLNVCHESKQEANADEEAFTAKEVSDLLKSKVRSLIAPLDVTVYVEDRVGSHQYRHEANWDRKSSTEFLSELIYAYSPSTEEREQILKLYGPTLRRLEDERGRTVGRAALQVHERDEHRRRRGESQARTSFFAVGGFVYSEMYIGSPYVGVMNADTADAARKLAQVAVSDHALAKWATEQGELLDRSRFTVFELMEACNRVISFGGDPKDLPFLFLNGKAAMREQFVSEMRRSNEVFVLLHKEYDENFHMESAVDLDPIFFLESRKENSCQIVALKFDVDAKGRSILVEPLSEEEIAQIAAGAPLAVDAEDLEERFDTVASYSAFVSALSEAWGNGLALEIQHRYLFSDELAIRPPKSWVLRVFKRE